MTTLTETIEDIEDTDMSWSDAFDIWLKQQKKERWPQYAPHIIRKALPKPKILGVRVETELPQDMKISKMLLMEFAVGGWWFIPAKRSLFASTIIAYKYTADDIPATYTRVR